MRTYIVKEINNFNRSRGRFYEGCFSFHKWWGDSSQSYLQIGTYSIALCEKSAKFIL